ncbi:MAG: YdbL family protein [Rhodospirillaceae bacterium]|nr:YdbL family protein [Rhodospirillaceae bacterium]
MTMLSSDLSRRSVLALLAAVPVSIALYRPAAAQSLDEARSQGYLGERPDGYVAKHDPASPGWVDGLMVDINEQRRAKYSELAVNNGTPLEAVEIVAGEKIIENLAPGSYYMDAAGNWMQK